MKEHKLAVEYVPIAALKLNPTNPRIHTEKQLGQLAKSIETFGFNVPVAVDDRLQVIAGHGRVMACRRLGIAEVPAIRLKHLNESQIRAFLIADNKLTENADWDVHLLGEQLKILADSELEFNLEITGFSMGEIDLFIENLDPATDLDSDPADVLPSSGPAVTHLGDVWVLGRHRVLCGNALSGEAFQALMLDQRSSLVFTDPPFNVPMHGHATGRGKYQHREFPMASGEMNKVEFTVFLKSSMTQLVQYTYGSSLHYICCDWRHMGELLDASESLYAGLENVCIWTKDNAGLGSFYRSQHEMVFVFRRGRSHRNNVQLGQFGRNRTNVWNYPAANSFACPTEEGNLLALHPTAKPVALVADAILDCSCRGDIVLDPFLGSGTTLIAAERTGRTCFGMELDPGHIDTIVRRWQQFTGLSAVHHLSEDTFNKREEHVHAGRD